MGYARQALPQSIKVGWLLLQDRCQSHAPQDAPAFCGVLFAP
jgi:hypothetical protein